MFYNAHVFVASKLYKSHSKLIIIGSLLPDISITKIIPWENSLHDKGNAIRFSKFVRKNYSASAKLYEGIFTHILLDSFSHNSYGGKEGYAYQNSKEILSLVRDFYKVDEELAVKKAHNYIESGVDILLLRKYPNLQTEIKKAIGETNTSHLAHIFASFFNIDESKFRKAIDLYFTLLTKNDLTKIEDWVSFWGDLEKIMSLPATTNSQKKQLLDLSTVLVKPTYQEFINFVIKQGLEKKNLV